MTTMLSPHFSRAEMACHHCGRLVDVGDLLAALEATRGHLGAPLVLFDAYRCPVHNGEVGGVRGSQHTLGLAADPRTPMRLDWVRQLHLWSGIGHRQGWVTHLDLRHLHPGTNPTRWASPVVPAVFVD